MLKERKMLEEKLEKTSEKVLFDKNKCSKIVTELNEMYELPSGVSMDFIAGRTSFSSVNNIMLFYFTDIMLPNLVEEYFTSLEQKEFKNSRYKVPNTIELPIKIKVTKLADDAYIGSVKASFFISLFRAQFIRYNANTQRVMRRIEKNEEVIYKPYVNKAAVNEIAHEMNIGTFLPNIITLNIPDDVESDIRYNENTMELVISKLDFFDITDGYHRLLAMTQCFNKDESFDYPMGIQITQYNEQKARQFISQEDKKTHMRKIDSESMDANMESNYVVERLNTDLDSNLKGIISRNDGIINYSEFSAIINKIYFKEKKMNKIEAFKDLKAKFNFIIDTIPALINNKLSTKTLYILTMICGLYDEPCTIKEKISLELNPESVVIRDIYAKKTYNSVKEYVGGEV